MTEAGPPSMLPDDAARATLIGRVLTDHGPTPVAWRDGRLFDLSAIAPTVSDLIATIEPGAPLPVGVDIGPAEEDDFAAPWRTADGWRLLAPIDLQCIKASGVTFAASAIERVIEERALGDPVRADELRASIQKRIGAELASVRPGSREAAQLKAVLIGDGLWSQYLEVAIGPDAEVFTKTQVLAGVGWGEHVGVRADSDWNNPEPEIVLLCDPQGRPRGATLGNDVNLRDFEGRSALLLSKAKDNTASCALGPFIRLFDEHFTLDDVRRAEVSLEVEGEDGYRLTGASSMRLISRDPEELVRQTFGGNHQYPDGFVLFLGTMFAPVSDRDVPGHGFTHRVGDIVRVSSPRLGTLENKVLHCADAPAWSFGISELMRNLVARDLIRA